MTTNNTTASQCFWYCPLYSFNCFSEVIDLVEGTQIKGIPYEFANYLSSAAGTLSFRTHPDEAKWIVALPIPENTEEISDISERVRNALEKQQAAQERLVDLIITLKFWHEGRVIAGPLIHATLRDSRWTFGGTTIWTSVSESNFFLEESKYEFLETDVSEVNNLMRKVREWRETGVLNLIDIAVRRFHSAYHGPIEDRLIDQMIAFESLFLRESQELTYKLAMRIAFLLGNGSDQREIIRNHMKEAYGYRSRIVHGNNPPSRDELRRIIPNIENYLRISILKFLSFLSEGHPLNEIRDKLLDENILKNGEALT